MACQSFGYSCFLIGFFSGNGRFERGNRSRHLLGQDDAFFARGRDVLRDLFANDLQHTPSVGLQHDDVTGVFRFEFVEHGGIS